MARYGDAFRNRAVAQLLPLESANVGVVASKRSSLCDRCTHQGLIQAAAGTRSDAPQSRPARGRAWTEGARLEVVITSAAMDEVGKSAWCREHGVYQRASR